MSWCLEGQSIACKAQDPKRAPFKTESIYCDGGFAAKLKHENLKGCTGWVQADVLALAPVQAGVTLPATFLLCE